MSLFVVNRYTGEDQQESSQSAQARLEKLKSEIAFRKQKRQQKKDEPKSPLTSDTTPQKQSESVPTKKRRLDKHKKTPEDETDTYTQQEHPERVKRKRQKADKQGRGSSETVDGKSAENGLRESSVTGDRTAESDDAEDAEDGEQESVTQGDDDIEMEEEPEEEDPNAVGGFSILGNFENAALRPVRRVLPDWLANPSIIQADLRQQKQAARIKDVDTDMKILDEELQQRLHDSGIHSFFPVQRQFIPVLMKDLKSGIFGGHSGMRPRDICVSAPTGSGKTLAFVLPILQALKNRMVPHIRAVVVLPVKDLAEQVFSVFRQYCADTTLKVGLTVGRKTLAVEQATLVKKREGLYHSLVDILVATPGRLVDHITSTPGFDLSHLRFLVVDEADRMMEDIKQDWLATVEQAAYTAAPLAYFPLSRTPPGPLTIASAQCSQLPLQKLLFSATLSHNPEKLQLLNLFMPRLLTSVVSESKPDHRADYAGQQGEKQGQMEEEEAAEKSETPSAKGFIGKYTTPEGLTEYFVECGASEKPLMVLHFLHNLKFRQVLCFTNSLESTHRLYILAKLFGGIRVREFSSRLLGERRKKVIKKFSNGKIDLLVCSDAMARGMDVENVKCVISYDNPPYIKTYIHRVGRTARAGRVGTSVSLLEKKEIFHFKQMMREAGKWPRIREMKVGRQALRPLVEPFQAALSKLPAVLKEEKKK